MGVMDGDIAGVRIIPPTVQFKDTEVKNVYSAHITVKNISKTCKSIRYYGPQTKVSVMKMKTQIHIFVQNNCKHFVLAVMYSVPPSIHQPAILGSL